MAVLKFKTFEDAEQALWNFKDTENSLTPLTSLYEWAKENNLKREEVYPV